jgi:hypothetical protein
MGSRHLTFRMPVLFGDTGIGKRSDWIAPLPTTWAPVRSKLDRFKRSSFKQQGLKIFSKQRLRPRFHALVFHLLKKESSEELVQFRDIDIRMVASEIVTFISAVRFSGFVNRRDIRAH